MLLIFLRVREGNLKNWASIQKPSICKEVRLGDAWWLPKTQRLTRNKWTTTKTTTKKTERKRKDNDKDPKAKVPRGPAQCSGQKTVFLLTAGRWCHRCRTHLCTYKHKVPLSKSMGDSREFSGLGTVAINPPVSSVQSRVELNLNPNLLQHNFIIPWPKSTSLIN